MEHLQITITGLKVLLVLQDLMAVPKCYPQLLQVTCLLSIEMSPEGLTTDDLDLTLRVKLALKLP